MTKQQALSEYLDALRKPFTKICRLRFLNPDGTTAFYVGNNERDTKSRAFVADGSITANLQNGQRRSATVTLAERDGAFAYSVNNLWYGSEIALDEGLTLPSGEEYYIQQGVFVIATPQERIMPRERTYTFDLVDKWANLDGTLFGYLDGTYVVNEGTNIFLPIQALLSMDRGNGRPVDNRIPIFTEYYNGKTQSVPAGGTAPMTNAPYTLKVDGESGTLADVVLGLAGMVNAWVGYAPSGSLRIDPSQDDILDLHKPVLWRFGMDEAQILGATYTTRNADVYNDYIVVGESISGYSQPMGRAQNIDPSSPTNINIIGRKTRRYSAAGYATATQCRDLAAWKLKRATVLNKSVDISCSQMFHIEENAVVEIRRTDKEGAPIERHLIQGFSRPLSGGGEMTISAVSVADFPVATII